jgi:hypothetical protein
MTAQPPQGGAKVSKSAFLTDVQPKAASDIGTPNPTPLESKERHQPLSESPVTYPSGAIFHAIVLSMDINGKSGSRYTGKFLGFIDIMYFHLPFTSWSL